MASEVEKRIENLSNESLALLKSMIDAEFEKQVQKQNEEKKELEKQLKKEKYKEYFRQYHLMNYERQSEGKVAFRRGPYKKKSVEKSVE